MKWSILPENPAQHHQFECTQFNNSILILEKTYSRIWQFDLLIESYSLLFEIALNGSATNTLATANMRVYVFEAQGCIYESDIGNEYVWKIIGECWIEPFDHIYKTYDGRNIFLALVKHKDRYVWLYSYFCFNLESKRIEKVKQIELDEI